MKRGRLFACLRSAVVEVGGVEKDRQSLALYMRVLVVCLFEEQDWRSESEEE